MAEAPKKEAAHDPMHDVYFVIGILAVLVFLWYMAGGPGRANLGGIFLHAPAPLDSGDAYGPNPQPDAQYQTETVPPPGQIQY